MSGYTFAFALALFRSHFAVRSIAAVLRSFGHLPITGSRPSDSPRVIINIDRASRDLAYFFYHLPVDRISWAFPYVPPGLYTQLVISRSRELQAAAIDPVEWSLAARFSYLHRPPMGRVNPQPQHRRLQHQPRRLLGTLRIKKHLLPLREWSEPRLARRPRTKSSGRHPCKSHPLLPCRLRHFVLPANIHASRFRNRRGGRGRRSSTRRACRRADRY